MITQNHEHVTLKLYEYNTMPSQYPRKPNSFHETVEKGTEAG